MVERRSRSGGICDGDAFEEALEFSDSLRFLRRPRDRPRRNELLLRAEKDSLALRRRVGEVLLADAGGLRITIQPDSVMSSLIVSG